MHKINAQEGNTHRCSLSHSAHRVLRIILRTGIRVNNTVAAGGTIVILEEKSQIYVFKAGDETPK